MSVMVVRIRENNLIPNFQIKEIITHNTWEVVCSYDILLI